MNHRLLANELNDVLAIETRSLLRHLDEAKPYLSARTYKVWADIQRMEHVSEEHSKRLSGLLESLQLPVAPASYPQSVADFHYMTVDRVIPVLIEEKERQIGSFGRAIGHAGSDERMVSELKSIMEEDVAQLRQLQGYQRELAGTGAGAR